MVDYYLLIRQAILARAIVTATYRGHSRELCPHILGHKDGKAKALLYQFAGASTSGLGPSGSPKNWRCVFLDELADVRVTPSNGAWHSADDYSPTRQTCIDQVDVAVQTR